MWIVKELSKAKSGVWSCVQAHEPQHVDTSTPPVDMVISSSEWRAAGFKLKEVFHHLEKIVFKSTLVSNSRMQGPNKVVMCVQSIFPGKFI